MALPATPPRLPGGGAARFPAAGLSPLRDGGFIQLGDGRKATDFVTACRELRFWDRSSAA